MNQKAPVVANLLLFLAALLVGMPWFEAYRSYRSAAGYLGLESGKQIRFVYVDKTHFDVYKTALWFDESLSIVGEDGAIYCNGRLIEFPGGKNVALVRGPGDVKYVELAPEYFQAQTGSSEIGYILGRVPHFKAMNRGMIALQKVKDDHSIGQEWQAFLAKAQ
jgi:hypothetical protein